MGLAGNTTPRADACGCMSVMDSRASEDFAADRDAWHKQLPYEAKAKEA
jgi:hypothetical protein